MGKKLRSQFPPFSNTLALYRPGHWLASSLVQHSSSTSILHMVEKLELSKIEKCKVRVRSFSETLELVKFKLANFLKIKS